MRVLSAFLDWVRTGYFLHIKSACYPLKQGLLEIFYRHFNILTIQPQIIGWFKNLERGCGLLLPRYMLWGLGKPTEHLRQYYLHPGQDSNPEPPEYKSSSLGAVVVGRSEGNTFTCERFPVQPAAVPALGSVAGNDVSTVFFFFCDEKKTYKGKNKRETERFVSQRVAPGTCHYQQQIPAVRRSAIDLFQTKASTSFSHSPSEMWLDFMPGAMIPAPTQFLPRRTICCVETESWGRENVLYLGLEVFTPLVMKSDRLCTLVVRGPGYRSRGPGSILGDTTFCEK
jgi:hypothetical protein